MRPRRELAADPDARQREARSPDSQARAPIQGHCAARLQEAPRGRDVGRPLGLCWQSLCSRGQSLAPALQAARGRFLTTE